VLLLSASDLKVHLMTNTNARESAHPIDAMFLDRWSPRAV
jgi:hypothetical protein